MDAGGLEPAGAVVPRDPEPEAGAGAVLLP